MSLIESPPIVPGARSINESSTWTDERIAELTRLWLAEELTAYQIACAIGGFEYCDDGGKNAVIGKARRLKLKAHRASPSKTSSSKPRPKTRHIVTHLRKLRAEAKERAAAHAAPEPAPVIISSTPCSLLELTDDTCRFPIGEPCEPGFMFCGGMAVAHAPYCSGHMRIAYTPRAAAVPRAERTETGWG